MRKVVLNKSNFARSLSYESLEDLVALYILGIHTDYKLLPSSCKLSEDMYEFFFRNKNKSEITCQVKNQEEISINYYYNKPTYEKIYIFSGLWDDDEVEAQNRKALIKNKNNNIIVVKPSELYNALTKLYFDYLKLDKFYEVLDRDIDLESLSLGKIKNTQTDSEIIFNRTKKKLLYSKEFNSIFQIDFFDNDKSIRLKIFNDIEEENPFFKIKQVSLK